MPYIGRGPELGVRSRFIYTATANQTSFSGNDDAGISLAYTDTLYMDVYQNGVLLVPATDYAATTGTSVVLVQGASVDDTVELLVFDIFSVADSVSAKDGGSFAGNVGMGGTLSVTGVLTADAGIDIDNFNIDGTTIALSSGDMVLDSAGDIILDADGADIVLKDGGTIFSELDKDGNNFRIKNPISDGDVLIQGNDGGSTITALTLDMSEAGAAIFNSGVVNVGTTSYSGSKINIKTDTASEINFWDAGDGNTIQLKTYSVHLRIIDVPNNDPCIQFEAAGNIDIDGAYLTGGFDYAEYFESTDNTAIPVGTSVVLENEKVRAATSGEQPLGVVRPNSDGTSVVGGTAGNRWAGKYLKDDYDAYLYDTVNWLTWADAITNEDFQCWEDRVPDGWTVPSDKNSKATQRKRLNPAYVENLDSDGNQIYVNRAARDEWNCIGLLGQVPITKDQPVNSNWTKLKDISATVELYFIK